MRAGNSLSVSLAAWRKDAAHGLRSIARRPGYSAGVVLALWVGLTVSIASFSIFTSILVGDQPGIRNRVDLYRLSVRRIAPTRGPRMPPTLAEFQLLRASGSPFGQLAGERDANMAAVGRHGAVGLIGTFVSGNYFDVLGTTAAAGRLLRPDDERAGADPVVVVSEHFWKTHLDGQDLSAGPSILLAGRSFTVVGAAEARFHGREPLEPGESEANGVQVWIPLPQARSWPGAPMSDGELIDTFGRLEPGLSLDETQSRAAGVASGVSAARTNETVRIELTGHSFGPGDVPGEVFAVIAAMMSVPLTVLLIGCANVANLQLARATERARELAVRAALGAGRWQLMRLLTIEALILVAAAIGLSALATTVAFRIAAGYFPFHLALEWRATVFALVLMLGVTMLTGLAPAWIALRRRDSTELKRTSQAGGLGHSRLRSSLIVIQAALSLAMLCSSGVFLRAVDDIAVTARPALREQIVAEFDPGQIGLTDAAAATFRRDLIARLETDSRVTGVATSRTEVRRYRATDSPGAEFAQVWWTELSASWLRVMDLPQVAGRPLRANDDDGVVVVSARFAEQMDGAGVVGRSLRVAPNDRSGNAVDAKAERMVTIVGVVADNFMEPRSPGDRPDPVIYSIFSRSEAQPFVLRVRTTATDQMSNDLRSIVQSLQPGLPWMSFKRGDVHYTEDAAGVRSLALAIGGLGAVALALATAGLYAVMAYVVQLRRREFGVRIAIGADARRITSMVMRQAFRLVGTGALIGLAIAIPLGLFMRSIFVGVLSPLDPVALGSPTIVLLVAALLAALAPARRAARTDPMRVLRED